MSVASTCTIALVIVVVFRESIPVKAAAATPCNGSYRFPADCFGQNCDYQVRWSVNKQSQDVSFNIVTKVDSLAYWTGIGFNVKPVMNGADLVVAAILPNGTASVRDMTSNANYDLISDTTQNLDQVEVSSSTESANKTFLVLKFRRKLDTGDGAQDQSLKRCLRVLFPTNPGRLDGSTGQFRIHQAIPQTSPDDMCFGACVDVIINGSQTSFGDVIWATTGGVNSFGTVPTFQTTGAYSGMGSSGAMMMTTTTMTSWQLQQQQQNSTSVQQQMMTMMTFAPMANSSSSSSGGGGPTMNTTTSTAASAAMMTMMSMPMFNNTTVISSSSSSSSNGSTTTVGVTTTKMMMMMNVSGATTAAPLQQTTNRAQGSVYTMTMMMMSLTDAWSCPRIVSLLLLMLSTTTAIWRSTMM